MSASATKLGLLNIDGKSQTPKQLLDVAAEENAQHSETIKQALWDGDPSKESFYDGDTVKSTVINWYFDLLRRAEKYQSSVYPHYSGIV